MSAEAIARTIQFILAPVVMVSACALLANGILARYAVINDRLRALARERLELLHGADGSLSAAALAGDAFKMERLREIDRQLPGLQRRHEMAHHAALAIYAAIFLFVLSMFAIACAVIPQSTALATMALVIFLSGTAVMLVGVLVIGLEIRTSNDAVQYEVERVMSLGNKRSGITSTNTEEAEGTEVHGGQI